MIIIPLKVKHVLSEFILNHRLFLLLLFLAASYLLLLKLVAIVVATSLERVTLPCTQTYPAKLMGTHLARNVIASLVFFDRFIAFRAVLGINQHPINIIAFTIILSIPLADLLALSRSMPFQPTFEAELVPTQASDFIQYSE